MFGAVTVRHMKKCVPTSTNIVFRSPRLSLSNKSIIASLNESIEMVSYFTFPKKGKALR